MSAQTTYRWDTVMGAAGGIVDLAPYAIDTFANEENDGVMQFGIAVVGGTNADQCKVVTSSSAATDFLGVSVNNRTTELAINGDLTIANKASVGVMRWGRIYVKVASGLTITPGEAAYVIISGDDIGKFTNSSSSTLAVKARFLSAVDGAADIAQVELFNQAQA